MSQHRPMYATKDDPTERNNAAADRPRYVSPWFDSNADTYRSPSETVFVNSSLRDKVFA